MNYILDEGLGWGLKLSLHDYFRPGLRLWERLELGLGLGPGLKLGLGPGLKLGLRRILRLGFRLRLGLGHG